MAGILNIRNDDKPLYINTHGLTAILSGKLGGAGLAVYNTKGQVGVYAQDDNTPYDAARFIEQLSAHGKSMVDMPMRYEDTRNIYAHYYIAPESVYFITVSKPDKDGYLGVIIGVEGLGRAEIYGATQQDYAALLNAVQSCKHMNEYDAEEASARWMGPDKLYIDPQKVTRMSANKYNSQIDVTFCGNDRLDVQLPTYEQVNIADFLPEGVTELTQEILQDAHNKALAQKQQNEEQTAQNKLTFLGNIAARHGNMAPLPSDNGHIQYVDRAFFDAIATVQPFERKEEKDAREDYYLTLSPPGGRYDDSVTLKFNTAAARADFIDAISHPAAKKSKKTDTPKP